MSQGVVRHIDKLSEDIGPRPAASAAERSAADYVSIEMEQFADEVAIESYGGLTTFVWMYLSLFVLALAANLSFFSGSPQLAFVASLAVIVFLNQEINAKGFYFEFFPKKDSQNVVGVIEATHEPKRRVIITASLDSGKDGLLLRPGLRRNFRTIFQTVLAFLILQVSFTLLAMFMGSAPVISTFIAVAVRLLGLVELATIIGLLIHRYTGKHSPGANDNASGIAALLEAGKRISANRPDDTEVWLVATGGGRSTQSGIINFMRRHWNEIRGDRFVALNHVGAGTLGYTLGEGILKTYAVDKEMVEHARLVSGAYPEWGLREIVNRSEPTDLVPLLAMGMHAISVRADDTDGFGVAAYTAEDTPDVIEDDVLERAIAFTVEFASTIGEAAPEDEAEDADAEADEADDAAEDEDNKGSGEDAPAQ